MVYKWNACIVTAGSWRAAAFKSANAVAACTTVLARVAGTLVNLSVTELSRVAGQALTQLVAVTVHTRPVVAVHRGAPVNLVLAPVSVVACIRHH